MSLSITRAEVEDLLFLEASLLDDWELEQWLTLFEEGATYWVPPAGSDDDAHPSTTLFYIADDWFRMTERVKRLGKKTAHVEFPKSRCRHMVSNVRILGGTDEAFRVTANFVTYRTKASITERYLGHHNYQMTVQDGSIRIRQKTSFLDTDDIYDQGKVSIIV